MPLKPGKVEDNCVRKKKNTQCYDDCVHFKEKEQLTKRSRQWK